MKDKNIKRAAVALFESQGDDKNKLLASFIPNEDVKQRVKDQGRALQILEKIVLPTKTFDFSKEDMEKTIRLKLEKKGHRIQGDDEPDTEEYAKESAEARAARLARVPTVLGRRLEEVEEKSDKLEEGIKEFSENKLEVKQFEPAPPPPPGSKTPPKPTGIVEEVSTGGETPEIPFDLIGRAFVAGLKSQ